jgi:2,4-dienoyl-CoA reductase-like NADH-dependent reductase (Old Yellow Enzyme family)
MPARFASNDTQDASPLGKPLHFEFSGKTANNRFLKAAMTERLSSWDPQNFEARGIPSKELQNVYKRWGEGGLGHILTGVSSKPCWHIGRLRHLQRYPSIEPRLV